MDGTGASMVHLDASLAHKEDPGEKGLNGGALGLISSVVVGASGDEDEEVLETVEGLGRTPDYDAHVVEGRESAHRLARGDDL